MPNQFRIADIDFMVEFGRLDAFVDNSTLCWGIEVAAATENVEFARWQPRVTSDVLFATPPHAFSHWQDLAPRSTAWKEKNDTDVIPSALLYVFEHTPIYECRAECYVEAGQLRLRMSGKCDVYYSRERYDEDLELEVDTPLDFVGILCGRRSEEESRESLVPFLDNADFTFTQTDKGVAILMPKSQRVEIPHS